MRKYHRTMNEAFPGGPDYACSMYRQRRNVVATIGSTVLWVGMFASMLGLLLAYFDVLVP